MDQERSGHELVTDVRVYTPEDYPMVCSWWDGHKWPQIPQESLSKTGLIVEVNNVPVCAGWIYKSDSNLAWFEWLVCDPKAGKEERNLAIPFLIETVKKIIKAWGFSVIFMSVSAKHRSLIKRLTDHGFEMTDSNMVNFIWS